MHFEAYQLQKKELLEKELPKEIVGFIESSQLGIVEKMEVLLVRTGKKPVTDIDLFSQGWKKYSEERKFVDKKCIIELQGIFQNIGLAIELPKVSTDEYVVREGETSQEIVMQRERVSIVVGTDEYCLKQFHEAQANMDDEVMGRLYGFPQTAIDAYLGKKEGVRRQNLPEEICKSDFYPFIQWGVLSKDNWKKEIETAKVNANTVKRNSQKIFEEYVRYIREDTDGF